MKLVTSAQMRTLEERAVEAGVDLEQLMENAGLNVAQEVWMQLGHVEERRIVVLVGPGNNGGDGLVAARHLAEWGAAVRCYALAARDDAQWEATVAANIPCGSVADDDGFEALDAVLEGAEVVIDALLGTGQGRAVEGDLAEILRRLAAARGRSVPPKLIAVDLPTGLDADSGRADPLTVAPNGTVTFQYPKVGALYAARCGPHWGRADRRDRDPVRPRRGHADRADRAPRRQATLAAASGRCAQGVVRAGAGGGGVGALPGSCGVGGVRRLPSGGGPGGAGYPRAR